jgi:Ulp1 family protease
MEYIERSYIDEAIARKMTQIVDLKTKKLLKPFQKIKYPSHLMPQQNNSCDCGVFMLMMINFLIDKIPFNELKQEDMPLYRLVLGTDIIRQKMNYYK